MADAFRDRRLAMAAMVVAMGLLPVGDAIAKFLTEIAAPFEIVFWRIASQALIFLPLVFILRRRLNGRLFSWASLLSGIFYATVMICLVSAFQKMPIATAIAIFFVEPLILTLLSWPLLGERPGPRRFLAVGIGLIGAVIVIRPNFSAFGPVALFPLGAAIAYALNMIVFRHASRSNSTLTLQIGGTFVAALGLLILNVVAVMMGHEATQLLEAPGWVLPLLVLAGAQLVAAFLLIAYAFGKAEASLLAPFQYLEIVGATIIGYLIFGDFPDALTWLGTGIILLSGCYVFYRERKSNESAPAVE